MNKYLLDADSDVPKGTSRRIDYKLVAADLTAIAEAVGQDGLSSKAFALNAATQAAAALARERAA